MAQWSCHSPSHLQCQTWHGLDIFANVLACHNKSDAQPYRSHGESGEVRLSCRDAYYHDICFSRNPISSKCSTFLINMKNTKYYQNSLISWTDDNGHLPDTCL